MRRRWLIIILLYVIVGFNISLAVPLRFVDVTNEVLSFVNALREDPVGFAQDLNISYEQFYKIWEKNASAIWYGLLPLRKSEVLKEQAIDYILSIVEGNKPSAVEDTLLSTRIELYVAFEHIIPEEEALKILLSEAAFKAIMGTGNFSAILFPPYTNMAAILASLSLKIGGSDYNVYALVIEVGIAEDKPLGNYVVGKVSPSLVSLEFFNQKDRSSAFIWPSGIYFTVLEGGGYFVHVRKKVKDRVVDSVIKENFTDFPVRKDF